MMKNRFFRVCLFILIIVEGSGFLNEATGQSNDHIFPPAPAAKSYMNFDSKGFLIHGKRTFLVSAGLEYARIPRDLWYDRLLRLKRCGFNCVEFYTFWNFHEPHEGQFDFTGDHDLNAFLKLVKKMNMYAIARVGPYYCAEWNLGGYPIWLKFKDSLQVRVPNAEFEKYVDRYFAKLLPIIRQNQINHGGAVIMVQLENEHPSGWGTYMPNKYFSFLKKEAQTYGIEVPCFFSGLHHGADPAGNKKSLDDKKRPNPWFTTEFWSVWFNRYGSDQKDADDYGRRTWKIIAHGGNGYNYYMAHGGSDFGYTNSNEDAASYDYGAAVGQAGDLRPIYYQFKRNALFARSFEDILENSSDADLYGNIVSNKQLVTNTRHSVSGDILFLDNPDSLSAVTKLSIDGQQLPSNGSLTLSPGEIMPVVHKFRLTDHVWLDWSVARILGISEQGNTKTIVVYGSPGSAGELWFLATGATSVTDGKGAFQNDGNKLRLRFDFGKKEPQVYSFVSAGHRIRVLALSNKLADRTWLVNENGINQIIIGPQYVDSIWICGEQTMKAIEREKPIAIHKGELPMEKSWKVRDASQPAQTDFDDSRWLQSKQPLQMGADGDISASAWYRTRFNAPVSGWYRLDIRKGGDRFIVFLDNKRVAEGTIDKLRFQANAGSHVLVIFAAHDGRDKLYGFTGNLARVNIKGISGNVILHRGKTSDLTNWKSVMSSSSGDLDRGIPSFNKASSYQVGDDLFQKKPGFAWLQTEFPKASGRVPDSVHFASIDDKAVVFINGKRVGSEDNWNQPFTVPYAKKHDPGKPDLLTVFIENRNGSGGIDKPVEVIYKDDIALTGWRMKGGPGELSPEKGWRTLSPKDSFDRPTFFKTNFELQSSNPSSHPIWRVSFTGLSHGFIWVNGHNLGRYPEKIPISSLYIPECWLKPGKNEIIIFDEYGNRPDKIKIQAEMASSRDERTYTF